MGHFKKEKTGNCIHLTHLLTPPFLSNPALFYGETDSALMGIRDSLSSRDSRMLQCSAIVREVSMTMIQTHQFSLELSWQETNTPQTVNEYIK